jgi:cell fate regulator YaaT (PSP1 superfamily)
MSDSKSINSSSFLPRSYMGGSKTENSGPQNSEEETGAGRDDNGPELSEMAETDETHYREDCQSNCRAKRIEDNPQSEAPEAPDPIADKEPEEDRKGHELRNVRIAGVRFGCATKIYHFNAGEMELEAGAWVIVKTEKGMGLGKVASEVFEREVSPEHFDKLRNVVRKAHREDFEQWSRCRAKESEAFAYCCHKIEALELPMKLVSAECFFDQSKYVFYFTADGRVDFRELVKQLVARFPVRIEMRQIGVRHEAKMTGGLGCCGLELCCSKFLVDFKPVSVRMAKDQNLSLNPGKISGSCGRLMCCLSYEHDTYEQFKKQLPRLGKQLTTEKGEATVVKHNALEETVTLRLEDGTLFDLPREELLPQRNHPRRSRCDSQQAKGGGKSRMRKRPRKPNERDDQDDEIK